GIARMHRIADSPMGDREKSGIACRNDRPLGCHVAHKVTARHRRRSEPLTRYGVPAVRPGACEPHEGSDERDGGRDASVCPQPPPPCGSGVGNVCVLCVRAPYGCVGYGIDGAFQLCQFHVAVSSRKHSARCMPASRGVRKCLIGRRFGRVSDHRARRRSVRGRGRRTLERTLFVGVCPVVWLASAGACSPVRRASGRYVLVRSRAAHVALPSRLAMTRRIPQAAAAHPQEDTMATRRTPSTSKTETTPAEKTAVTSPAKTTPARKTAKTTPRRAEVSEDMRRGMIAQAAYLRA